MFDQYSDHFLSVPEGADQLSESNDSGEVVSSCRIGDGTLSVSAPHASRTTGATVSAAGATPSGDGTLYVQDEDDETVFHVSRRCEILEVYKHERFGEASLENDQLASDTVTFGEPAIWIHDSQVGMVAYSVPGGYCPIPSTLRVVPETTHSRRGVPTPLCAVLTRRTSDQPIPGAVVRFFVDDAQVGTGVTDLAGKACATYIPNEKPKSLHDVDALFLGNISFLPSRAEGMLSLAPISPPNPEGPIARLRDIPRASGFLLPPGPPPPPDPLPDPAQAPAPNPQTMPDAVPANAQASQTQPMVVTQRQEQPQMALVHSGHQFGEQQAQQFAMNSLKPGRDPLAMTKFLLGLSALSLVMFYGYAHACAREYQKRRA
jgi:hypothetical protein